MTKKQLTPDDLELLQQLVAKQEAEVLPLLTILGHTPLTTDQRERLRGAIAAEFAEIGVDQTYEPNARGLWLESLIDQLGHY